MSTDEADTLPRKKHSVLWWVAGFFVLLLLLFFFQLFGPNPPIIVSPQTTYITAPLGADGLPDYEQHWLESSRAGVTPENNAVVLLWQALFPGEVDPQFHAAVAMEFGLEQIPFEEESLQPLYKSENRRKVAAWLQRQGRLRLAENRPDGESVNEVLAMAPWPLSAEANELLDVVDSVIDQAQSRPWTSEQIPPLAEWVAANQEPLDLIVEASRRPRYYAPSPTLLDKDRDMLIAILLPHAQSVREAARSLPARAMWHLGEGRPDEAWQDLLAIHRLSHLITQGHTLVEQLVAIAIRGIACEATMTLLDHGDLTLEQARQVQRDLAALPNFAVMARSLDQGERLCSLDTFIHVGTGGGDVFGALSGQDDPVGNAVFNAISVDWNLVLRETNRWFDRLAAAARLPDRQARSTALAQIDTDLQQLHIDLGGAAPWLASVVSRHQRSELVSTMMLSLMLPAVTAATNAEDRANTSLELTRLAAALAVFRAEHGAYPEKLADLVPGVLERLPVDLYSGKPPVYKRDGEGYLLYSAGENGRDDGGSNERERILKGQPLDDLGQTKADVMMPQIPTGADDISIRVPRPAFELPNFQAAPE